VLKSHDREIDWSLPRKDSKGRKPTVVFDKDLTIEQASMRRDITINAMAIDLTNLCENFEVLQESGLREQEIEEEKTDLLDLVKELAIIDPHGGLDDIKNKRLRVVDKVFFLEDPLRFYRVMQFVGRFEMEPDEELSEICEAMDLRDMSQGGEIARERIYEEIKKLLLRSARPSLGFRWVEKIGRLEELFPELGALVDVAQRPDYHPEGVVFEHTMQALDAAASFDIADDVEKFTLMLGVLCHDFGKAVSTDENGRAKGHDIAGVPLAKRFLRRFTWDSLLVRSVCKLVRFHRMPIQLVEQESTLKAYKRLALKLSPEVTTQQLYFVAAADVLGRNPDGNFPLGNFLSGDKRTLEVFLEQVEKAQVKSGPEEPVLHGRDLLGIIEPGPKMGELLKKAYDIQIDQGVTDKEVLKSMILGE